VWYPTTRATADKHNAADSPRKNQEGGGELKRRKGPNGGAKNEGGKLGNRTTGATLNTKYVPTKTRYTPRDRAFAGKSEKSHRSTQLSRRQRVTV
jgi:hypothetical protein